MNETGRTTITAATAPAPIGPYSQGIKSSGFIFVSGQLGLDAQTGNLVGPDAASQARQALQHLQAILESGGAGLGRVVKTTIFLIDMNDFAEVNKVYGEFFGFDPPARSTIQVAALPKGGRVEIEAIAQVPVVPVGNPILGVGLM
jgi:2-iminobutanoate/2-iminopropanoate deaminase